MYLSAVRYCHITAGETPTLPTLMTPQLNYVLKGIRKTCAINQQPQERQPITFPIMECLHMVLSKHPQKYEDVMIWAACCIAYFGLLRVSEFTTSSSDRFLLILNQPTIIRRSSGQPHIPNIHPNHS